MDETTTPYELIRAMLSDDIGLRLTVRGPHYIVTCLGEVLLCTTKWPHVVAAVCYWQVWDCSVAGAETVVM